MSSQFVFNPFTGNFDIAGTSTTVTSGGASPSASFITVSAESGLTNERRLTGTSNQIILTDNGANSTLNLALPQDIATGSSPQFTGLNLSGLASGRVVITNGVSNLNASSITSTELAFLSGVSSNLQTQLNTLNSSVTGVVPVIRGGTGLSSVTSSGLLIGNGDSTLIILTPGTEGQVLKILGGSPVWGTITTGGSGSGSVTSVGFVSPGEFTVTNSPITTSGDIVLSWNSQSSGLVLASPATGAGTPYFRTLTAPEIPALDASKITSGILGIPRGGTGLASITSSGLLVGNGTGTLIVLAPGTEGQVLTITGGSPTWGATPASSGSVSSVGLVAPQEFTVSNSPITSAGNLTLTWASESSGLVLASPASGAGSPTFRALTAPEIPALDASKLTSGILSVPRGGTGFASVTPSGIIYGNGTGALLATSVGSNGFVLSSNNGTPIWVQPATGTVSYVRLTMPSQFSTAGSPVTSSGAINVSWNVVSDFTVLAGPSPGGEGGAAPSFRLLTALDIPSLDTSKLTSGTLGVGRGGTGFSSATPSGIIYGNGTGALLVTEAGANGQVLSSVNGIPTWTQPSTGSGTVTSVSLVTPQDFSVSGSPVTNSGTLSFVWTSQASGLVLASPASGAGTPTFRTLTPPEIPSIDTSKLTSGVLGVPRGGTGFSSAAPSGILYGDGTNSLKVLSPGTNGQVLSIVAGTPTWTQPATGSGTVSSVELAVPQEFTISGSPVTSAGTLTLNWASEASGLVLASPASGAGTPYFRALTPPEIPALDASKLTSGILGVLRGGTGVSSITASGLLIGNDTNPIVSLAPGTNGQFLVMVGNAPTWATNTSTGTVTSVGLTAPQEFSVAGSPVTSAGTLALTWGSQASGLVLASPVTGAGTPTFRSLTAPEIPSLDASKLTSGILTVPRGGTGIASATASGLIYGNGTGVFQVLSPGSNGQVLSLTGGTPTWITDVGTGTVTYVRLSMPSQFTTTGNPVTSSGAINVSWNVVSDFTVFAGPSPGGEGGAAPSFRLLTALDIPSLDTSKLTSGTLGVARGGTGVSSITSSGLLIGNGTGALVVLSPGAEGQILKIVGNSPAWATNTATGTVGSVGLSLPSDFTISNSPVTTSGTLTGVWAQQASAMVLAGPSASASGTPSFRALVAADIPSLDASKITSGIIGVPRGGTGLASVTGSGLLLGNGTSALTVLAPGSESQILSIVGGTPSWRQLGDGTRWVWEEVPAGAVNGVNTTFTLVETPNPTTSVALYKNGLFQQPGASNDYTISGTTITFNAGNIPQTNDIIVCNYATYSSVISGYNPSTDSTLGTLRVWFEFGDPTTLFKDTARTVAVAADGDKIQGVTDLSGLGNHFTQATSGNAPTYKTNQIGGVSAALFTRANSEYLTGPSFKCAPPFTIYLCTKLASAVTATRYPLSSAVTNGISWYYGSTHIMGFDQAATVAVYGPGVAGVTPAVTPGVFFIETLCFNGTNLRRYWDGVLVETANGAAGATWSAAATWSIGWRQDTSNGYYDGHIASLRMFDGVCHTGRQILDNVKDMYNRLRTRI